MTPRLIAFDADRFLAEVWQQKPLLIRNPWQHWANPLEPDELAGLACEAGVESRLIRSAGADGLSLEHGPLGADRFSELGHAPWTLLVQAVDHHVPEVAALLDAFRFIPNWRVDDVMVSYATDGGGVGAHFDQYDVFLVQGQGRRRWRVGARCDDSTPLLPHDDLRLLAAFEPVEEWVLEPGDILYVPPGFAHDGVAVGNDCMTYSLGFRAPSRSELVEGFSDHVLDHLSEDDRYTDAGLVSQANPGEISATALARLHAMIREGIDDPDGFARWFGQFSTAPKNDQIDWTPEEPFAADDLAALAASGATLERNPASRFSYVTGQGEAVTLFVDGAAYDCTGASARFAGRLCADQVIALEPEWLGDTAAADLILTLLNHGSIAFSGEE